MNSYPKQILSLEQQLQSYKDSGMLIHSDEAALKALNSIGYYRLRGYAILCTTTAASSLFREPVSMTY